MTIKKSTSIHIGTSGWSYKHWKKDFYPEKLPATEWLSFYAGFFDVTEINSSFYHVPSSVTTEGWKKKVPPDFRFCPKMNRFLTHMKKLLDPEEVLLGFFHAFSPLKRKLGPVLIQLPPFLAFEEKRTAHLYKLLKKKWSYYDFAMEVRHPSWLEKASIELMKDHNIAFVISQSGVAFPYAELVTADHVYLRFHGPAALYASGYSPKQLKFYAGLFNQWEKEGREVWAFFNNDIGLHAVKDAKRLASYL